MSRFAKVLAPALLLLLVVAVAVVVLMQRNGRSDPDKVPVATIGGVPISKARFEKAYIDRLLNNGRNDTPVERFAQLDNLVQIRLLADEARRRGLDQGPEYGRYMERHRLLAAGAVYFEEAFAQDLPPLPERAVREAYRNSHEQVLLRHLFFDSEEKAQMAVDLLRSGEDFVDLANEVFDTPAYDSSAGMLGAAGYWALDDDVAEVAFSLTPFEISHPVRSRYGWHVLRVEDRLASPILSESDFQMRRDGIEGRARIRRNRMEGDRWVRRFMQGLGWELDDEAARAVVETLRATLHEDGEVPQLELSMEEIASVRREIEPSTVVVRYILDGGAYELTAGDFAEWLPELPYVEVRDRPVAAIGRALRNEALGRKGLLQGLDRDEAAQEAMQHAEDRFLADRLREQLRADSTVEPTEDDIRAAFDRLQAGALKEARADYWVIPFDTYREADAAESAIRAGTPPTSYSGFERLDNIDVRRLDIGGHVRRAPLDTPAVFCLADRTCSVLNVSDRTLVYTTLDEKKDELRQLLVHILPEERLTDSLYAVGEVHVDTTLFRRMMER